MDRLLEIMARLRAPGGCPWDIEQTPATLKPQLLEECYEVLDAIDSSSPEHLTEELGDLLLHVVFQAQIAREAGNFTFADVATGIADKLVRRHPHVFGDQKVADADNVVTLWHQLKKAEKPERESALDGVPRVLPALMRAEALQKKARDVGFDWPDAKGSLEKVREEVAEATTEIEADLTQAATSRAKFAASPETGRSPFLAGQPDAAPQARRRRAPHASQREVRPPFPRHGGQDQGHRKGTERLLHGGVRRSLE